MIHYYNWEKVKWLHYHCTGFSASLLMLLKAILLSNVAQFFITCAYLLFNDQITRVWREYEWRSFYRRRKKPRTAIVSGRGTPSTRWLQLPYNLSALMITVSILLHWVACQAFYCVESYSETFQSPLVFIVVYQIPFPTLVLAILWTSLVITIIFIRVLPQSTPMPIMAGSARVVLASCCRLTKLTEDGIMWGDITELSSASKRQAGFASSASDIVEGAWYS